MPNINHDEVAKFSDDTVDWWNENGPMKALHQINPVRLEYLQQFTELKDRHVLDVGCGGGIYSEALAKAQAKVTALDANKSAIEVAKAHSNAQSLSIEYHQGLLEDFADKHHEKFDIVTCMELLEHVPDPAAIIKQCATVLKPGGILCLSTINRTLKAYGLAILAAEYILRIVPAQTHDYEKLIRPSELESMIRAANCELHDLSGMGYNPFKGEVWLQQDVSINYLMCCKKL